MNQIKEKNTNIIRKARGKVIPKRAQRVFFSCDVRNSNGKDALVADLLSMDAGMDCVVSWLETPDAYIDETLLRNELRDTQVIVLWVTVELLQSIASGKLPVEYLIAQEVHTPILPIATYGEFFPEFTRLVGAVHGIAMSDSEYRLKLKSQLETFLTSEKIMKQIQENAFTARIFLSYRKIDIEQARSFMTTLHNLEEFEAVSVWYDNFLTAGRVFDKEIRDSIDKCDVFVLLVTPNLMEKNAEGHDNYVMSTEYPYAYMEARKPIVPVHAVHTNLEVFAQCFPGVDQMADINDSSALFWAFHNKFKKSTGVIRIEGNQAYLLGMAYLKGFGVERDAERAMRLLETAFRSNGNYRWDAALELANTYENGIGINIDYEKALYWRIKVAEMYEQLMGTEDHIIADMYIAVSNAFFNQGKNQQAMDWCLKALRIRNNNIENDHAKTAECYNNLAAICTNMSNYSQALEWNQKAVAGFEKACGKEHPNTIKSYNNRALILCDLGDYTQAFEWIKKVIDISEKVQGTENTDTVIAYNNMGMICNALGNYQDALEWNFKALTFHDRVLKSEHPDTAISYTNIAHSYSKLGEYEKALDWNYKALSVREKILGNKHPITAYTYNNIADNYSKKGEHTKAIELYLKALAIYENLHMTDQSDTAVLYDNIATNYMRQGDYQQGLEYSQKALIIFEKVFGNEHPSVAISLINIAYVYYRNSDFQKALELNMKAFDIRKKTLGAEHPEIAVSCNNIADIYENLSDYQQALEWHLRSFRINLKLFGVNNSSTLLDIENMMNAFILNGGNMKSFEQWMEKRTGIPIKLESD